eukprot:7240245-Prymnesium_polylepis.1
MYLRRRRSLGSANLVRSDRRSWVRTASRPTRGPTRIKSPQARAHASRAHGRGTAQEAAGQLRARMARSDLSASSSATAASSPG